MILFGGAAALCGICRRQSQRRCSGATRTLADPLPWASLKPGPVNTSWTEHYRCQDSSYADQQQHRVHWKNKGRWNLLLHKQRVVYSCHSDEGVVKSLLGDSDH